jgi:hypothetical protein
MSDLPRGNDSGFFASAEDIETSRSHLPGNGLGNAEIGHLGVVGMESISVDGGLASLKMMPQSMEE